MAALSKQVLARVAGYAPEEAFEKLFGEVLRAETPTNSGFEKSYAQEIKSGLERAQSLLMPDADRSAIRTVIDHLVEEYRLSRAAHQRIR